MITLNLDRHIKMPLYEQLYRFIKKEIESGRLGADEKLPSKRKLAGHLKISYVTVETAYAQLVAEGYLKSVPKSGYYVQQFKSNTIKPGAGLKAPEAEVAQEKQVFKYDFKTNIVDTKLFPYAEWAKLMREVLRETDGDLLNYTHPQGSYRLRREIVRYLHDYRGINTTAEQVIVGSGSEYLIGLMIQLLGRENKFGAENPGYGKIYRIFECNQIPVEPLPLDGHGIDIERLYRSGVNIVHITPSHQFPLGIVMPVSRRAALLDWVSEHDGRYIIEDDYDSEFRFSGQPIPALQGLDGLGRVIYTNAFTKSLAPSLRISYVVLPPDLLKVYRKKFMDYSCTVPNFEQYTLAKFMNRGLFERHLNRMRNTYKQRRDCLINALYQSGLADICKIAGQDAGLHLLLSVKNGMDEQELIESAKRQGVKVYGLSEYYRAEEKRAMKSTLVIGYSGIECPDMAEAVSLLKRAWNP